MSATSATCLKNQGKIIHYLIKFSFKRRQRYSSVSTGLAWHCPKPWLPSAAPHKPSMTVYICDSRTQEVEGEGSVQGHPRAQELEAGLGQGDPVSKRGRGRVTSLNIVLIVPIKEFCIHFLYILIIFI